MFAEIEAGLEERRQILEDCKTLKQYAAFHLHPERPVLTKDPTAFGRCYFDRPSAPQQESVDNVQEHVRVMEECVAMRTFADFFLYPQHLVKTTDPNFSDSRPSPIPQMSNEDAEQKTHALEDALIFQQYAKYHLHPERRVVTTDPAAYGRNYFTRPSAIPQETPQQMEERNAVMEDVEIFKATARYHMHPELPVITTDPMARGRNYFERPSAPEQETAEEMEERNRIMKELAALRMHARFHLHPELPVETTDVTACARCYFDRFSAPAQETLEEAEERNQILEDAARLEDSVQVMHTGHTLEQDYFHDHPIFAQNAANDFEQEPPVESEECKRVLEETANLKMYAAFHLHPERAVKTTDPYARERCFFDRVSSPEQETPKEAEERHQILQDAAHLEEFAQVLHNGHGLQNDYFHDGHFTMDEDEQFDESDKHTSTAEQESDSMQQKCEDEGNLSRSPSGVFELV